MDAFFRGLSDDTEALFPAETPVWTALDRLKKGIKLGGEMTLPAKIAITRTLTNSCYLEIVIKEGKKRQIRRMLEAVGHPVRKLRRIKIGFLTLEGLQTS